MYKMFRKHFRRKSTKGNTTTATATNITTSTATATTHRTTPATSATDSLRMCGTRQRQKTTLRSWIDNCRSLKFACNLIALILILLVHKVSKKSIQTSNHHLRIPKATKCGCLLQLLDIDCVVSQKLRVVLTFRFGQLRSAQGNNHHDSLWESIDEGALNVTELSN